MASASLPQSQTSSPREQSGTEGGMVDLELAAARALADLAVSAATGSESAGSGSRSRKRNKSESSSRAEERSFHGREDTCSTSGCGGAYAAIDNMVGDRTDIKQSSEMIIPKSEVPSKQSSCRGARMKQNLTEDEKEERRLRRILANRESARQTIRRRQALWEELRRKVADLSSENENMKMEKDVAMKEYLSLKDTNEQLKEQIAKTMRSDVEINVDNPNAEVESPTSSTTMSHFIIYGKSPANPCMYPSWPIISGTSAFFEQGNPSDVSRSLPTYYMSPCAWYYPFHHEVSGSTHYSHAIKNKDAEHISSKLSLMQSYKELEIAERASLPDSDEKENIVLGHAQAETKAGARGASRCTYMDEQVLKPTPEMSIRMESFSTTGSSSDDKSILLQDKVLPEKQQGACTRPPDKLSGMATAAAAAEARKRRKELTKLKQSQGRQTGMPS
ncbi:hypothetical protein Cni_G19993 [Canna indica]|uniref:BZIP domain-containing protein n=1 Tax=Canna indica TaxID=4628 RepID=A0AAQ3KSE3_9LILI|nr:hypothetical protein Cni_G19993 [Canna indica]